jgi:hypothetical protein
MNPYLSLAIRIASLFLAPSSAGDNGGFGPTPGVGPSVESSEAVERREAAGQGTTTVRTEPRKVRVKRVESV